MARRLLTTAHSWMSTKMTPSLVVLSRPARTSSPRSAGSLGAPAPNGPSLVLIQSSGPNARAARASTHGDFAVTVFKGQVRPSECTVPSHPVGGHGRLGHRQAHD